MVASFVRQLDLGNTGKVGYDEIAHALRVLETRVLTSDGATPSSGVPQPRQGGPSDWYLEDITLEGRHYLVDRHTMRVYAPPAGIGRWPTLAGRFMGGRRGAAVVGASGLYSSTSGRAKASRRLFGSPGDDEGGSRKDRSSVDCGGSSER